MLLRRYPFNSYVEERTVIPTVHLSLIDYLRSIPLESYEQLFYEDGFHFLFYFPFASSVWLGVSLVIQ